MTKTISLRRIVIVLFILMLLFIAIKQLLPYPHPKELLIQLNSIFPNFSIDTQGIEYETQMPQDGLTINEASVLYWLKSGDETHSYIHQYITQFESCEQASRKYFKLSEYEISNAWIAVPDIKSESKIATQSDLTCYQSRSDLPFPFFSCRYKAQYEVYIVQLYGSWDSFIQIDNIKTVIKEIDAKMSMLRKGCIQ